MAKNVDNPEKENDPKHFAGRGGGLIILYFFYKYLIVLKESLTNQLFSV